MSSTTANIVPGQWIVTLKPYETQEMKTNHVSQIRQMTADSSTTFSCEVDDQLDFDLPEFRGYCAKFDVQTKAELEAMDDVAAIEPVQIYHHCKVVEQDDAPWGLARVSNRGTLTSSTTDYAYHYDDTQLGEGTVAYVVDTGINDEHVEFEGRASKGPKFVTQRGTGTVSNGDTGGHGTHVAATICGKTYGMAKKARVVGVKVFGDGEDAGATNSDIIKALEWVTSDAKEHGDPSVLNLSLGGGPSQALDRAVAAVVRAGITVCCAAGNETTPVEQTSPAREPLAISVGATNVKDEFAPFSNYGKIVDILAPGVGIESAWIGGTTATNTISGTSMASPHVAGAVCCLLSSNKKLSPLEVMPKLLTRADRNLVKGLKGQTVNVLLHNEYR